jgi:anaerobic selenocysteine-containing dehydrogenase
MMELDRRKFLKTVAIAAAASALPGCEREAHNLVPYLLPDDEIVPGVANWYASVCGECPAGCGIIVRVMEGRAKKIEGNPDHPVNKGKLCARGQAALQRLYNPDRIQGPLRRTGTRGAGNFEPISWDEALALWVNALQQYGRQAAMITKPVTGTLAQLFSEFMRDIHGDLFAYDPSAELPLRAAAREVFGTDRLPFYDLAHADYLVSFGAPFLEDWISPVAFGRAFGHFRQGRPGVRGRFIQIEPRLSVTAASADRWLPIRPGTEGLLADGLALVVLTEGWDKLPASERRAYRNLYTGLSLEQIVKATGIALEEMQRVAREFSSAAAPLAMAGGQALAHTNGTQAAMAVHRLNVLRGTIGLAGGVQLFEAAHYGPPPGAVPLISERGVGELAEAFDHGRYALLQLYHANPLFTVPPSIPVRRLFDKAAFIVSFSSFVDESTAMADLILPDHTSLESWGDQVPWDIAPGPVIGLRQPVVRPRWNSRATGDVFLDAAKRMQSTGTASKGPDERLVPHGGMLEMVRTSCRRFLSGRGQGGDDEGWRQAWGDRLQAGGWWDLSPTPLPLSARPSSKPVPMPVFNGDEREFPLYFTPFPSPAHGRGEGANLPWLQQLPDPLTTAVWGTWIEINPRTAREYGIHAGEMVRVRSPYGEMEAPAVLVPGIRPDTVAMPMGQGHVAYGRYASQRGVNPLILLSPLFDEQSGALATGATRVQLEATGKPATLVLIEQVALSAGGGLISIDRKHGETPI